VNTQLQGRSAFSGNFNEKIYFAAFAKQEVRKELHAKQYLVDDDIKTRETLFHVHFIKMKHLFGTAHSLFYRNAFKY
jgi:hypothetical protein